MASIRAARVALAVLVVLGFVTAGCVSIAAQDKVVTYFWCEIKQQYGQATSQSGQRVEVGVNPGIGISRSGDETYAYKIEALSISDQAVVLRVRFKRFTRYLDDDAVRKQVNKLTPQQITYIPGQQITISAEGGGNVILSGLVKHEAPRAVEPQPIAALIPAADEMQVAVPTLIRDRTELLAYHYSGIGRFRCNSGQCGFYLYAPKHGLFFFSIQPLPNAIEGAAGVSAIEFSEGGHNYTLFSALPITGGEIPRKVSVVHVPKYLPSQHRLGGVKSDNALVGSGQADLSTVLAVPLRKKQQH